jgi:nucleotide-binding universal stress UspA family protein
MQDTLITPPAGFAPLTFSSVVRTQPRTNLARRSRLAVRRILLPFDLSRASVCALRAVTQVAEKIGATIHLLHVVKPAEEILGSNIEPKTNRADDSLAEESERMLKHWVKRVVQGRVQTFVSIRIGDPVDVIVARAVAMRADLIVMTSRSTSASKNELQRCTAERISRLAPCPVLTIPEKCADELAYSLKHFVAADWGTVLLPIDFSAAAQRALAFAAELSERKGARLLLAHGCDSDDPVENEFRLQRWAEANLNEPVPFETAVWPGGHSLYAILSEALRSEANLIILPTQVDSWARRLRAGSITDGALRQARCPVLTINENVSITEN